MKDWKKIKENLIKFLQDELEKTGVQNVVFGLSGGLDSAVVAVLCKEAFKKESITAVLMPSSFSSQSSVDDSIKLCEKFDINYEIVSIEPMLNAYIKSMQNDFLRIGNFSARLRMSVLFDISSVKKALVVGTSNKSEILLGYSTIFGDSAYAFNPIGDIYKSDLFNFAEYLGVNSEIIEKKPSADFYSGQSDEDDLGYTYSKIDSYLKAKYDEEKTFEELKNLNFEDDFMTKIDSRVKINEFKRKMPKIASLGEFNG
jgi:NAD+ synthase